MTVTNVSNDVSVTQVRYSQQGVVDIILIAFYAFLR